MNRGDPISATELNAIKDSILGDIVGGPGIGVHRVGGTVTVSNIHRPIIRRHPFAVDLADLMLRVNEREDAIGQTETEFTISNGSTKARPTRFDLQQLQGSEISDGMIEVQDAITDLIDNPPSGVQFVTASEGDTPVIAPNWGSQLFNWTRVIIWNQIRSALDELIYVRVFPGITAGTAQSGTGVSGSPQGAWDSAIAALSPGVTSFTKWQISTTGSPAGLVATIEDLPVNTVDPGSIAGVLVKAEAIIQSVEVNTGSGISHVWAGVSVSLNGGLPLSPNIQVIDIMSVASLVAPFQVDGTTGYPATVPIQGGFPLPYQWYSTRLSGVLVWSDLATALTDQA